jgi:hypothetical protein
VAFAVVLSGISVADAGKGGKKSRRSRSHDRAEKRARHKKDRAPTPAPADAAPDAETSADDTPAGTEATPAGRKGEKRGEKVFDFTGLELAGSVRMPQLLYFLDRAEEELERASLERRSFVPAMMRSLDEESL